MKWDNEKTVFFISGNTMKCYMCRARIDENEHFRYCPNCGRKVVQFVNSKPNTRRK